MHGLAVSPGTDPLESPVHQEREPNASRRDQWIFRCAVALATTPILIAAVRNGAQHWFPSADAAITAVRTNDVFSAHPPLVGLPAFPSTTSSIDYSYLGAPINYLLALPVKVWGTTWGTVIGMGLLNSAWFVTALWLIRRRIGYHAALLGCLFGVTLLWGVGSQALIDPTPVRCGIIAMLTLFAAAWSVADGDSVALLPLSIAANFLILDHLKFIVVAPLLSAVALMLWAWQLRRRRVGTSPSRATSDAHPIRWLLVSGAVGLAMWIPTLVQQFFTAEGNIGDLVRALAQGSSGPTSAAIRHGPIDAIGVASSTLTTWPLWFRNSMSSPNFSTYGPASRFVTETIGIVLVTALFAVLGRNAYRRRDKTAATALLTGFLAWVAWLVSALVLPTESGWALRYFQALWPMAMFAWFTLAIGTVRTGWLSGPTARRQVRLAATIAVFAVLVVFVALSIPIANFGAATSQDAIAPARQLRDAVAAQVRPGQQVLVNFDVKSWPYVSDVVLGLQKAGAAPRFESTWALRTYGAHRKFDPRTDTRRGELFVGPSVPTGTGWKLVTLAGPGLASKGVEYLSNTPKMEQWAAHAQVLRPPASAPLTSAQRAFVETITARSIRLARARGTSVLDDPQFIDLVTAPDHRYLLDAIDARGMTRGQKLDWLRVQAERLHGRAVFVYQRE